MDTLEQFSTILKIGHCNSIVLLGSHCELALYLDSHSRVNQGQVV